MLTIENVTIAPALVLSSLSGISDLSFRTLCRRFGCPFAFYEMFDVNSVIYKNRKTCEIQMKTDADDRPIGAQILGNNPEKMLEVALLLQERGVALIDVNAACPVPKVVNNRCGAYMLRETGLLRASLKKLAANLKVPLTVKIRSGWSSEEPNAVEVAKMAQDSGVKAIFIHGRSAEQRYTGPVCYEIIRKVKEAVTIPVIGSGDVFSGPLAEAMFKNTHCDGVVVARGSLGNPWIFRELTQYLEDGTISSRPTLAEIYAIMLEHLHKIVDLYGERKGVSKIKKHISWYLKLPGKKKLKSEFFAMKAKREIQDKLSELLNDALCREMV